MKVPRAGNVGARVRLTTCPTEQRRPWDLRGDVVRVEDAVRDRLPEKELHGIFDDHLWAVDRRDDLVVLGSSANVEEIMDDGSPEDSSKL